MSTTARVEAGRLSRTTYMSELLAPVERLADAPAPPAPESRLVALSWAFALVAVAALVVCGLIVYDVVHGSPPATHTVHPVPAAWAGPASCPR